MVYIYLVLAYRRQQKAPGIVNTNDSILPVHACGPICLRVGVTVKALKFFRVKYRLHEPEIPDCQPVLLRAWTTSPP